MNDSSNGAKSNFEGLRHQQTSILIEVLRDTLGADRGFVERKYRERAIGFFETLAFLASIQAVKVHGDRLLITKDFTYLEKERSLGTSGAVLRLLSEKDTPYRQEMLEYINQFRVSDGSAILRPTVESRSADSAVRNYLIDLGIVSYDSTAECYRLNGENSGLFACAQQRHKGVLPSELKRRMQAQEELGQKTEAAVIGFERLRVGSQYAQRVEHIGIRDVAAGYDILSVTVCKNGTVVPRYIEVKAVPVATYRFYWSANEIAMAESFGNWYYLYLVPVKSGGQIEVDSVHIIEDPHAEILGPRSVWNVETGVVKCNLDPRREQDDWVGEGNHA